MAQLPEHPKSGSLGEGVRPRAGFPKSLVALAIVSVPAAVAPILFMMWWFQFSMSSQISGWGATGDFLGGVSSSFIALINVLTVIWLAKGVHDLEINRDIDADKSERSGRELQGALVAARVKPILGMGLYVVGNVDAHRIDVEFVIVNEGIGPAICTGSAFWVPGYRNISAHPDGIILELIINPNESRLVSGKLGARQVAPVPRMVASGSKVTIATYSNRREFFICESVLSGDDIADKAMSMLQNMCGVLEYEDVMGNKFECLMIGGSTLDDPDDKGRLAELRRRHSHRMPPAKA